MSQRIKWLFLPFIVLTLIFLTCLYFLVRPPATTTAPVAIPQTDQPAPTQTQITGTVKDASGQPIDHAFVSQGWSPFAYDKSFHYAYTDADGTFVLTHVKIGDNLLVTATAPGFSPKMISGDTITADPRPVALVLGRGHTLKFHFVDPRGKPVSNVLVEPMSWHRQDVLRSEQVIEKSQAARGEFISDENGDFVWDSAPADAVEFSFSSNGPRPTFRRDGGKFTASDKPIQVTLEDVLLITGAVTDAHTHQPIPHFNFFIGNGRDAVKAYAWYPEAHAAEHGSFTYADEEPSPFAFIRVEAPGYPPMIQSAPRDKGPATFSFELSTAGGTSITILTPQKEPVVGASVYSITQAANFNFEGNAAREGHSPSDPLFQTTGEDGRVLLSDPGKTPERIVVIADDGFAELPASKLRSDPTVILEPWASLNLHVHDGDKPVAHTQITINLTLDETPQAPQTTFRFQMKTSATGDAVFSRIPPRPISVAYELAANDNGPFSQAVEIPLKSLTPTPDQSLDLPLDNSGQIVTGKLVRPANPACSSPLLALGEIDTIQPPSLYTPQEKAEVDQLPREGDARKKWNAHFFKANADRVQAYIKMRDAWYKAHPADVEYFVAHSDGLFAARNIPPGERTLLMNLLDPATGKPVATYRVNFTVPEKTSSTPLDLGDLSTQDGH